MFLLSYWCPEHGWRVTALLDPAGRARCDAAGTHDRRFCYVLLGSTSTFPRAERVL